jgi:hypothetical protein
LILGEIERRHVARRAVARREPRVLDVRRRRHPDTGSTSRMNAARCAASPAKSSSGRGRWRLIGHDGIGLSISLSLAFGAGLGAPGLWWGLSAGLTATAAYLVQQFLSTTRP